MLLCLNVVGKRLFFCVFFMCEILLGVFDGCRCSLNIVEWLLCCVLKMEILMLVGGAGGRAETRGTWDVGNGVRVCEGVRVWI